MQFQFKYAARNGVYRRNTGHIHNMATMNAKKFGWVKSTFQAGQNGAEQVCGGSAVKKAGLPIIPPLPSSTIIGSPSGVAQWTLWSVVMYFKSLGESGRLFT